MFWLNKSDAIHLMSRKFRNWHSLTDVLNLRYKVFFMESVAWLRTRSHWIVANQIVLGLFVPWENFCENNGNVPVCKKQPMLLFLFCHLLPCKIYNKSVQISVRSDPSSQLSHRWCTVVFMAATLKISFFPGGHSSWTLIENSMQLIRFSDRHMEGVEVEKVFL